MPPVFIAIGAVLSLGAATGATALAIGVAFVVNIAILGVTMLISYLTRPGAQTVTMQAVVRQPVSYRRVIYGQVRASGVMTYVGVSGSNNEYLHLVITLAGHQVQSITNAYIEGFVAHQGNSMQGTSYPYYQYETDLGVPSNTSQPFPLLAAAISSWDSTCLQRGNAKVHIALQYNTNVYPSGMPSSIAFDVQGKLVYDPRSSTTAYSDNPALVVRDWLTDAKYGMGASAAQIDDTYTIAAANICDQSVSISSSNVATIGGVTHVNVTSNLCTLTASNNLKVGAQVSLSGFSFATFLNSTAVYVTAVNSAWFQCTVSHANYDHSDSGTAVMGSTQSRYKCDGVVDCGQPRGDVLRGLLSSMAGYCVQPGDAWRIIAGAYVTPTIILTEDDLRGPVKMDTLLSMRDLANGITGTFISPANNWQGSSFPSYQDPTALAADGNQPIWQDIQLNFTTDGIAAQRLAKIYLERIRRQKSLVLPCKLSAFPLQPGDTVMFTFPFFGFNQKVFEVQQTSVVLDTATTPIRFGVAQPGQGSDETSGNAAYTSQTPCVGVDLALREIDSNVFAWNPSTDENTWLGPRQTTTPNNTVCQPPTSVTATSGSGTAAIRADGLIMDRILVQWTSPADTFVTNGGTIEIYTSPTGAGTFTLAGIAAGDDTSFYILNCVDGSAYDVLIFSVNAAGVYSSGVTVSNITASGGTTTFGGNVGTVPASQIAALTTLSAYSGVISYTPGMKVTYNGNVYQCIANTAGNLPTNTSFWTLIGPQTLDNLGDGSSRFGGTSSGLSYRPLSNPLTGHDAGSNATINIASFTMRTSSKGDISISSGSVTALSYNTLYYTYYDDSTLAGGSVTFHATTTKETALNGAARFFVGSIVTPVSGGPDTVGNNDGGAGAQSGALLKYTMTISSGTSQNGNGTLTNAENAIDGDPTTFATLTATGNGGNNGVELQVSGPPGLSGPFTNAQLVVVAEVTSNNLLPGPNSEPYTAGLLYGTTGTSGGINFAQVYEYNPPTTLSKQTLTFPLTINQNMSQVIGAFVVSTRSGASSFYTSGTVTMHIYEVYIQVTQ